MYDVVIVSNSLIDNCGIQITQKNHIPQKHHSAALHLVVLIYYYEMFTVKTLIGKY